MEQLLRLRIAPFRICLQTAGTFHTPEYKGALFRGGFGYFFRDLVCVTGMPTCQGCPHRDSCPYSLVFESPVAPEKFSVLRKYPNAPHPFVLTPPLDPRTSLPAGTGIEVGLVLIGRGIEYLPHFVRVFEAMGESGRYGGRFRVRTVVCGTENGEVVYDGLTHRFLGEPVLWKAAGETGPVRALRLEFQTPLRIRTAGRYNASPDFVAVTHALLRRIHLILAVYGGGNGDASWMHPLLKKADEAVTERADFSLFRWTRTSGRQKRPVQMDGVIGTLEASGDLTALAPYFHAGEWLHVGSGTSMGMGRYRVAAQGNLNE